MNLSEQKKIIEDYIRNNLTKEGYCATYAIHDGGEKKNDHAHILVTNRPINAKGEWGCKRKMAYVLDENGERIPLLTEDGQQKTDSHGRKQWKRVNVEQNPLDTKDFLFHLRKSWAAEVNKHLAPEQQIDHRSNAARGLEDTPTIHEGYAARAIDASGGVSDRCRINREIRQENANRDRLKKEMAAVQAELEQLDKEEREEEARQENERKQREQVRQAEQERLKAQKEREAGLNKTSDNAFIVKALRDGDLNKAIILSRNIGDSDERLMERAVRAFGKDDRPLIEVAQALGNKSKDLACGLKLYNYARDYREKLVRAMAERKQAAIGKKNKLDSNSDIAVAIKNNDVKKLTAAYLSHMSKGGSDEGFLEITAKSTVALFGSKMLNDRLIKSAQIIHQHSSMARKDLTYATKLLANFKASKNYKDAQNGIVGLRAIAKQDEPDEWRYLSETEKEDRKSDTAKLDRY